MIERPNTKTEPAPRDGNSSIWPEPPTDPGATPSGWVDNPENPRGIPGNLCDGLPDAQATDAQKAQNPTPARIPVMATHYPDPNLERVSAGQNRKPPLEQIP